MNGWLFALALVILLSFRCDGGAEAVSWTEFTDTMRRYGWRLLLAPVLLLWVGVLAFGWGSLAQAAVAVDLLGRAATIAVLVLAAIGAHIHSLCTAPQTHAVGA